MSELANKVKERLIAFIEYKELSVSAFEKACGLSNGYIRNFKGNLGGTKLEDILNAFPELDREWLLFGTTKSEDSVEEQPSGNATIDKLVTLLADKDNDIRNLLAIIKEKDDKINELLDELNARKKDAAPRAGLSSSVNAG